jgi:hypothetical protein
MKKRVLLFSPYSGIWAHSLSEAQLLAQLNPDEFEVIALNCGGAFVEHCAVRESLKIDLLDSARVRKPICHDCGACAKKIGKEFSFQQIWIEEILTKDDRSEIDRLLLEVNEENFSDFTFRGQPLGQLASYETLIKFKKTSLDLKPHEFSFYRTGLKQAMLSSVAVDHLLSIKTIDMSFIYSPQYSANVAAAKTLEDHNIPVYFVEGSSNIRERYSALRVWSWTDHKLVNPALDYYAKSSAEPISEDVERVQGHLDELVKAISYSVYSPRSNGLDIAGHHGIDSSRSILLSTLSSYDEAFSALVIGGFPPEKFFSSVFVNQFEWIRELVDWVSKHVQYHLVIRLHPRDLPNKRERVVSEQSVLWNNLLTNLPPNVSVDHPDDKISLHDYFPVISALTTGWSSTAIEGMLKNVPVITYDENLPSFPSSIHLSGNSKEEYFSNLKSGMESGPNHEHSRNALDWLVFNFCEGTIRVKGRLVDRSWITRHRSVQILFLACFKVFPSLGRRVDIFLSRKYLSPDHEKFINLVKKGAKNLFEV